MTELPLYTQLIIWLIAGSTALCFLLVPGGMLWRRITGALPAVPQYAGSKFPHIPAYFYTSFFVLVISWSSILNAQHPAQEVSLIDSIASLIFQIALYIPFLAMYFVLPGTERPQVKWLVKAGWVASALVLIWLASLLLQVSGFNDWLTKATDCPLYQDVVTTMKEGATSEKWLMVFMAVCIAPVTEEVCFRGFIYNILKRWNARWVAVLASSLLFAAIHGSLMQVAPLTLFAIIQCIAYEKARSLWLPIVIHTLFNASSAIMILFLPQMMP